MLKVLLSSSALVLLMGTVLSPLKAGKNARSLAEEDNITRSLSSKQKEAEESEEKEFSLFNALNLGLNMDEKTGLPKGWDLVDSAKNRDINKPISLKKHPKRIELLGDNYTFYTNVPALRDFDNTTFLFSVELRSTIPGVYIQYYDGKNAVDSTRYASKKGEWETLNIEFTVDANARFHRLYSAILGTVKGNNKPSVDINSIKLQRKQIVESEEKVPELLPSVKGVELEKTLETKANEVAVEADPIALKLRKSQEDEVTPPVVVSLASSSDKIEQEQSSQFFVSVPLQEDEGTPPVVISITSSSDEIEKKEELPSQLSISSPVEELKEDPNQPSPLPAIEPENQLEQPQGWGGMFYDYTLGPVVKAGGIVADYTVIPAANAAVKAGGVVVDYTVAPVANAAIKAAEATAGGLKAGAEYAAAKAREAQEAAAEAAKAARIYNRTLNEGIDFYPYIKSATQAGVDYMNQPSDFVVPPIAAHFLQGFSAEMMPVIENVLVNAIRLGGAKAGGELAKTLGLTQAIGDWGVNAYLNPLKKIGEISYVMSKINLMSHVFKGLNITALLGSHATKGILPKLEASLKTQIAKKMRVDPNAELKDPTVDADFSREGFKKVFRQALKDAPENARIVGFQKATQFTNKSLERTLASMLDDMEQFVGVMLKDTMKVVLFGTESEKRAFAVARNLREQEATSFLDRGVGLVKKYSNPVNIAAEITPDVVKKGLKTAFDEVNLQLGAVAGTAGGEALTEDLVNNLQLSKMQLFFPEQMRLNVSRNIANADELNENVKKALSYVDDFLGFDEFLGIALQRAGHQTSKKALNLLKEPLSAAFQKAGIHRDINELMFTKVELTGMEKVTKKVAGAAISAAKKTKVLWDWMRGSPDVSVESDEEVDTSLSLSDSDDEYYTDEEEDYDSLSSENDGLSSSEEFSLRKSWVEPLQPSVKPRVESLSESVPVNSETPSSISSEDVNSKKNN